MNGVPHPLEKFAVNGHFTDEVFADVLTEFIQDATLAPDSRRAAGACWFLLESRAFFLCCNAVGIDGEKLREHLRKSFEKNR